MRQSLLPFGSIEIDLSPYPYGFHFQPTVSRVEGDTKPVSISDIRASVQGSLDRLGTVPDCFLIHNPYVAPPGQLKQFWKVLEDLKDEGKLKSIGVSNFRPQDLEEILDGCRYKPVVNQVSLRLLEPNEIYVEESDDCGWSRSNFTPTPSPTSHPSSPSTKNTTS